MKIMDMDPTLLRAPDVCMEDFMMAVARIKPSVNEGDITEHVKWTEEFGQDG
jgi:vacuolar protein-sorting-associated protein 4